MASAGAVDSSSAPSSPLSSLASSSPAPPDTYNHPSPPSSYETDTRGSSEALEVRVPDHDEPPAAKRRKVYQPKPRTTEYLDLGADGGDEEHIARQNAQLRRLVENLRGKKKIVVIAGAGISVSAGSTFKLQHPLYPLLLIISQFLTSAHQLVYSRLCAARTT